MLMFFYVKNFFHKDFFLLCTLTKKILPIIKIITSQAFQHPIFNTHINIFNHNKIFHLKFMNEYLISPGSMNEILYLDNFALA